MIERLIHDLLKELGEDPTREGLEKTPVRVAKALRVPHLRLRAGRARRC